MIGSGAWACAAARMMAQNTMENTSGMFRPKIKMWAFEEMYEVREGGVQSGDRMKLKYI